MWTESREKAAQRAEERAEKQAQATFPLLLRQYATVAKQWIALHFAATVNGTSHEQSKFDPLRQTLADTVNHIARRQENIPIDRLTSEQIREEQASIRAAEKAVVAYRDTNITDPWEDVAAKIISPRLDALRQAAAAPEQRTAEQEAKSATQTREEERRTVILKEIAICDAEIAKTNDPATLYHFQFERDSLVRDLDRIPELLALSDEFNESLARTEEVHKARAARQAEWIAGGGPERHQQALEEEGRRLAQEEQQWKQELQRDELRKQVEHQRQDDARRLAPAPEPERPKPQTQRPKSGNNGPSGP